jgi:anti-anti-sigma factor
MAYMRGEQRNRARYASGPLVSVSSHSLDGTTFIQVVGELDLASADHLSDCLSRAVSGDSSRVVVDLSKVEFIDCAGWRPVADAALRLRNGGRSLELVEVSRRVRRLLDLIDPEGYVTGRPGPLASTRSDGPPAD